MVSGARTFSLEESFLAPHILNPPPTRHALLTFLLALAAVLHIGTAAWGDLFDGAEGQLAAGAREMLRSGQWLVPTNNGVPLLDTPPLAYWAVALSFKIFGVSATAAHLPIALAMIGSVAFTFLIGERLGGYWRGFAAGLMYLCSAGAFVVGRLVVPDAICSLFVLAAMYCALRGYQHRRIRRIWFAGFWAAAALATMTKGPAVLIFFAGSLLLLSLFFREARIRFPALLHWTHLLLFLLIVVPWFVWAQRNFPGFASHFFKPRMDWSEAARGWVPLVAWLFPALFLILPSLIFAARKIFRPGEMTVADALPLSWIEMAIVAELLLGGPHHFSALALGAGFALFAACAWERTARPLRIAGVALAFGIGITVMAAVHFRPTLVASLLDRSLSDTTWSSFRPLAQFAIGSFVIFGVAAIAMVWQRGEIMLLLALAAMVPTGFCLIESGARAMPFLSLAHAANYLNPRLGRNGEVLYEGSLRSGSSLAFYLEKGFFLVNERPGAFERDAFSQNKYLDEHFVLEAWERSDPIYLVVDETRVAYWRRLIIDRVHIYHQVTTCGSRVILSNQL